MNNINLINLNNTLLSFFNLLRETDLVKTKKPTNENMISFEKSLNNMIKLIPPVSKDLTDFLSKFLIKANTDDYMHYGVKQKDMFYRLKFCEIDHYSFIIGGRAICYALDLYGIVFISGTYVNGKPVSYKVKSYEKKIEIIEEPKKEKKFASSSKGVSRITIKENVKRTKKIKANNEWADDLPDVPSEEELPKTVVTIQDVE